MKKILSTTLFVAAMAVAFTGCLKDKGFDNHTYGINDPDTQPPGVGFPLAAKAKNDYGLDVSASPQVVNDMVYVNLESGKPASSDVHVTLTNTSATQVAAYNTANGTNIQVLPSALFSVATALTIPSGGRNVQVPITVSNTTGLNANLSYAIGLTISAVDGGYKIAENLKNLLIVFSVKNQYDGKYTLRGQFYHPTQSPGFDWFTVGVQMHTTGPNSVKMYVPAFGGYYHPGLFGGSLNAFSAQEPQYTVNPSTNAIVVNNTDATGPVYAMGIGFNNAGYNSRWVPASQTMYSNHGYNLGAGGTFILGTSRAWIDTLIRTGPR